MDITAEQIESIVQAVMVRLQTTDVGAPVALPNSQQLMVSDRVVTMAKIDRQLNSDIKSVLVEPNAVVTPAVVDLLNDKSIRMIRRNDVDRSQEIKKSLWLGSIGCPRELDSLREELSKQGVPLALLSSTTNSDVVHELIESTTIMAGKSIILAKRPFAFARIANRDDRLSAHVLFTPEHAKRAVKESDANVLVLAGEQACAKTALAFFQE